MLLTREELFTARKICLGWENPPMPLEFYSKHLDQIYWASAVKYLPYDFLNKNLPKGAPVWVYRCFDSLAQAEEHGVVRPYLKHSLEELLAENNFEKLFADLRISEEFFWPLFDSFDIEKWNLYLLYRPLNLEQAEKYIAPIIRNLDPEKDYRLPWQIYPYEQSFFPSIFFHSDLPLEFVETHAADAAEHLELLFGKPQHEPFLERFYPMIRDKFLSSFQRLSSPEFLDRHPELIDDQVFVRFDLPMWFIDKYKEKILDKLNSRPSKETLAHLKERVPELYYTLPWISLLESANSSPDTIRGNKIAVTQEKIFQTIARQTVFKLLSCT